MRIEKIKLFTNRINFDIGPILEYTQSYYLKHKIDLHIDIEQISVTGYKSVFTEIRTNLWDWILDGTETLVPIDPIYDITIFMFDQNEWKTLPGNPFPLRIDTPRSKCIVVNGKPFITLGVYSPLLNEAEITMCHELIHANAEIAVMEGYVIHDIMDMMVVDGVPQPYYLNDQPDNVNGNFINMWEQFFNSGFLKIEK